MGSLWTPAIRPQQIYANRGALMHSAKGSTWEDHKYIKRINGTYYYPNSYKGGRHLPEGMSADEDSKEKSGESKYSEYSKDDPDFDEKNYNDKNRLGDTDFYGFVKDDGTVVILEEDMKWECPPGTDLKEMTSRLEEFDKRMEQIRESGQDYTADDWTKMAKDVIDGKKSSGKSSGKLSDDDVENLAKETIRGNFGNGAKRKELLGDEYEKIQQRVNEILKGGSSKKTSSTKSSGSTSKQTEEHSNKYGTTGSTLASSYKKGSDVVSYLAEQTGMKESEVKKAQQLAKEKGYNSKEFKEQVDSLTESDDDWYQGFIATLKKSEKN